MEPEGRGLTEIGGEIYDMLSRPAHHRRGGFPETASVPLREFTYGPHPNAEVRACHVSYAGELIETAIIVVVDAIGHIIGREYVRDVFPEYSGAAGTGTQEAAFAIAVESRWKAAAANHGETDGGAGPPKPLSRPPRRTMASHGE